MNTTFPSLPRPCASAVRGFDQAHRLAPAAWQFDWFFASDDRAFDGHFPHQPILAGVFLLEMAQHAAEFALAHSGQGQRRLQRVERFRFFNPVLPGDHCTLLLEWPQQMEPADAAAITVTISKSDTRVAHGRLLLAACPLAVEAAHAL